MRKKGSTCDYINYNIILYRKWGREQVERNKFIIYKKVEKPSQAKPSSCVLLCYVRLLHDNISLSGSGRDGEKEKKSCRAMSTSKVWSSHSLRKIMKARMKLKKGRRGRS